MNTIEALSLALEYLEDYRVQGVRSQMDLDIESMRAIVDRETKHPEWFLKLYTRLSDMISPEKRQEFSQLLEFKGDYDELEFKFYGYAINLCKAHTHVNKNNATTSWLNHTQQKLKNFEKHQEIRKQINKYLEPWAVMDSSKLTEQQIETPIQAIEVCYSILFRSPLGVLKHLVDLYCFDFCSPQRTRIYEKIAKDLLGIACLNQK